MAQTVLSGNLTDAKPVNLLTNGGFDLWSGGLSFSTFHGGKLCDGFEWRGNGVAAITRESGAGNVESFPYSLKAVFATSQGGVMGMLNQIVPVSMANKTITLSARIKCDVANAIKVGIDEGSTQSYSSYHTGDGTWQTITVTKTISATSTSLSFYIGATALGDVLAGTWYVDSVTAFIGDKASAFFQDNSELDKVKSGELLNLQIASYGKNKIINGNGLVDQRYASNPRTVNTSTWNNGPDRWHAWGMPAAGVFTLERAGGSGLSQHNGHIKITVTTADASVTAGDSYWFGQNIEGWRVKELDFGSSNYRVFTLSFFVRSSVAGTFAGGFVNDGTTRSYVFTYTVNAPNVWEYKTITTYADNTGTWNQGNLAGLRVLWDVGSGSSYEGTVNAWQAGFRYSAAGSTKLISTNGATLSVTGVQLEVGPRATPYDHRGFGEELALCQRYFETSYDYGTLPGTPSSLNGRIWGSRQNGGFVSTHHFKVSKRAAPSLLTIWSPQSGTNARVWNFANNADEVASADDVGTEGFHVSATTTTAGHAIGYHFSASAEF